MSTTTHVPTFADGPVPFSELGAAAIPRIQELCPRVFACITRSKNGNVVCYEAKTNAEGHLVGVEPFWLDLEPSYREAARKRGRTHDRDELGIADRLPYGFTFKVVNATTGIFRMDRASDHDMYIRLSENGTVAGLFCRDPDSGSGIWRVTGIHVEHKHIMARAHVRITMESLRVPAQHKNHELSGNPPVSEVLSFLRKGLVSM